MHDETEYADYYRAGSLRRVAAAKDGLSPKAPPWVTAPPCLETYALRGARQLAAGSYRGRCFPCVWANMSAVTIIWDFDRNVNKYRFESFCYGPKSCRYYSMGRARRVSYKGRNAVYDEGWMDEMCTEGRGEDE